MAGSLKALTFDWWGTLYVHREARTRRLELLGEFVAGQGAAVSAQRLESAYQLAMAHYLEEWQAGRVFSTHQWLRCLLGDLGLEALATGADDLCAGLEEAMLETPPRLVPGAAALLTDLHRAGVRLGLISDTGLTVGRVMRRILAQDGILSCFGALVFSDEIGVVKPHSLAFETALAQLGASAGEAAHVGDLPETDLAGARAVGMKAVLVTGVSGRADDGLADAVVRDFGELRCLCGEWRLLPAA